MSNSFVFTGAFGSGKTLTAVSFVPPSWPEGQPVRRVMVDAELRSLVYRSKDGMDYPEKQLYGFEFLGEKAGRVTGASFHSLMRVAHDVTWKVQPQVLIIDDVALIQDVMSTWWKSKKNVLNSLAIYGMEGLRLPGAKNEAGSDTWSNWEPGATDLMQKIFQQFFIDLRAQGCYLIGTSPLRNIWDNYGAKGTDADGNPKMKILGQSAKVWKVWLQMTDVIWNFNRIKDQKLTLVPAVSMDAFMQKASLPGVPESFIWPGWKELWTWNEERRYVADPRNIVIPEPQYDPEGIETAVRQGKARLVKELAGQATVAEIGAIMSMELAPDYTLQSHEEVKEFILRVIAEKAVPAPAAPPTETEPVEPNNL